ncbi:MAG TPA: hypothetical protein VIG48_03925 [Jatrophihabitans sp.]
MLVWAWICACFRSAWAALTWANFAWASEIAFCTAGSRSTLARLNRTLEKNSPPRVEFRSPASEELMLCSIRARCTLPILDASIDAVVFCTSEHDATRSAHFTSPIDTRRSLLMIGATT